MEKTEERDKTLFEYRMALMQTLLRRNLEKYLNDNDLTKQQFADLVKLPISDIHDIIEGSFAGSVVVLTKLSVILNYNPFTNIK